MTIIQRTYLLIIFLSVIILCMCGNIVKLNPSEDVPPPSLSNLTTNPNSLVATGTKCECAVFDSQELALNSTLIVALTTISVECNTEGSKECVKVCSALAKAAKGCSPQMLCIILRQYRLLKASVFSRVCGAKEWTYTNLTSSEEICCHELESVPC